MAERLSDLLHRSVDDVDVPRPDTYRIAAQGRTLRTRRRVGTVLVAAVLVGAVGGGLALTGSFGGEPRGADIAHPGDDASAAYDAWAAWSTRGEVTIGGTSVDVPGDVHHLAQTSAGVVAQGLDGATDVFTLVRPDGGTAPLSIPGGTPTVDGDPSAPRVAWVESRTDELVLHVWDVTADAELGRVVVPSPGTTPRSGRQVITPVDLDGDAAYVGTADGGAHRISWRTGAIDDLPLLPMSVRAGVATALDGDRWVVMDAATGAVRRRLSGSYVVALVSPDGRRLYLASADGEQAFVEATDGGGRVRLDGLSALATWSRDGAVVGQVPAEPRVERCTTDGSCTSRDVPGDAADLPMVLIADFLNVG